MNVPFSIVLIAEVINIMTQTEAIPGWRWGAKSKHKRWNKHRSETDRSCSVGQCVAAQKCPKAAVSNEYTADCAYWNNEPWVCCVLNNVDSSYHWDKTYSTKSPSRTIDDRSKQKSRTNTQYSVSHDDGHVNEPCLEDPWNRNSREKPSHVSPLGDILKNIDKLSTSRPWKKTTENFRNKQTAVTNARTTSAWNKPYTSEPRIVFPTEVASVPKITKNPTFTTKISHKSTSRSWTRSTQSVSTTKKPWGYTTGSTRSAAFKTTKSWTLLTQSTSTTKKPWRYTTVSTGRTVSKTTRSTYSQKPTVTTRASTSEERRNQGWGNRVTGQTKKPRNTERPRSTRSTSRTTKKYEVTTPLPNVNIHLCGIRDKRTVVHRQGRNYKYENNPAADVINSGTHSKDRQPYERIVGGEEAEPFSWPWVVALYKVTSSGGNRFLSAGTLINENFVLTAAHVFTPDDLRSASYVVMLGTHDAQDAVAEYMVSSVLQHPRYEHRYYYHDIALLRLEKPVVFNNYVMPVCLPSPTAPLLRDNDLQGKNVTVMGWGDVSFGGKSSRFLKQATFPIVSRISCNASYVRVASNRFPKGITEDMLCAGDPNGGKDACQGDSGGPLTSMENGRYTQVGIVSFGYQCGDKEFPGVYTKVARYLSWIAENTYHNKDYVDDYDY